MADTEKHEWMNPDDAQQAAIRELVEQTDLSPNQAADLVREHGTDREKLMKIAATMKAEG